jgi:hypothetical protein
LDCVNSDCVCGDFDLSEAISQAVRGRQSTASDEIRCLGWLDQSTVNSRRCHMLLRFKLSLEYATVAMHSNLSSADAMADGLVRQTGQSAPA